MFERAKTLYNRWTSCRFCQYAKAALSWLWNLRFLPDSARRWVFGTGTRALQIVNIGFLLVWAWVFGVNGFGSLPLWTGLTKLPRWFVVLMLLLLALLSAWSMWSSSSRSHAVGVGALRITPLIWLLLATSFWVRSTLSAQVVAYVFGIWSLAVWLVGEHLQDMLQDERQAAQTAGKKAS